VCVSVCGRKAWVATTTTTTTTTRHVTLLNEPEGPHDKSMPDFLVLLTFSGRGFPCNSQAWNELYWMYRWKGMTGNRYDEKENNEMSKLMRWDWWMTFVTSLGRKLSVHMQDAGHAGQWGLRACLLARAHARASGDREVATPVDNSIDHTVRAVHSHPGPWEEAKTVQIYTTSKETGRRRRRRGKPDWEKYPKEKCL